MLALFGELDNNIEAGKNRAAWDAALGASRHPDYTLRYYEVVLDWLSQHVNGFGARW